MTISEAVSQGIARLRLPIWADKNCYLKLDIIDGHRGPWGHLFSRETQEAIGEPTPQDLLLLGPVCEADDYEPYTGPKDVADVDQEDDLKAPPAPRRQIYGVDPWTCPVCGYYNAGPALQCVCCMRLR